jgi:hypothetical protein
MSILQIVTIVKHKYAKDLQPCQFFRTVNYSGDNWFMRVMPMLTCNDDIMAVNMGTGRLHTVAGSAEVVLGIPAQLKVTKE